MKIFYLSIYHSFAQNSIAELQQKLSQLNVQQQPAVQDVSTQVSDLKLFLNKRLID